MKLHSDERGGAPLTYVVLISLLLMTIAPMILFMISNNAQRDRSDSAAQLAETLAISGMETFLAYLQGYEYSEAEPDPEQYLNQYPLLGTGAVSYEMPEGQAATIAMTKSGPSADAKVTVELTATVAAGDIQRTRVVSYTLNVGPPPVVPTEPQVVTNPDERIVVEFNSNKIYMNYDCKDENNNLAYCSGNSGSVDALPESLFDNIDNLRQSMDAAAAHYATIATRTASNYVTDPENKYPDIRDCTCNYSWWPVVTNPVLQIQQLITEHSGDDPVLIRFNSNEVLTNNGTNTFVFGSPEKPVVLIFNNLHARAITNMTVYGDVIVNNNLTMDNGTELKVYQSGNGQYGNLIVLGKYHTKSTRFVHIDNLLYANALEINVNEAVLEAGMLVVNNTLNLTNRITVRTDYDVIANDIKVSEQSAFQLGGDLLVRNDFILKNPLNVTAGGVIGIGGTFELNQPPTNVTLGGGTSSVIVPADSSNDGGGDDGGGDGGGGGDGSYSWGIERVR